MKVTSVSFSILLPSIWTTRLVVVGQEWELLYHEDFTNPLPETNAAWILEDYATPFDTILDDNGM
jgi:hypothetical protein